MPIDSEFNRLFSFIAVLSLNLVVFFLLDPVVVFSEPVPVVTRPATFKIPPPAPKPPHPGETIIEENDNEADPGPVVPRPEEADAIRIAIFDYFVTKTPNYLNGPILLGVSSGDPSTEVMDHFRDRPFVQKASTSITDSSGVRSKATGVCGESMSIGDEFKWISNIEVQVYVVSYGGPGAASGLVCTLRKEHGVWRFKKYAHRWIT